MNIFTKNYVLSIIFFLLSIIVYEFSVYVWTLDENTPIIRVDVFLMYPIILVVSLIFYLVLKKYRKFK